MAEITYQMVLSTFQTARVRGGYREFLPHNKIPTLLYCGDKDSYYESAKECAEIIPNSSLRARAYDLKKRL